MAESAEIYCKKRWMNCVFTLPIAVTEYNKKIPNNVLLTCLICVAVDHYIHNIIWFVERGHGRCYFDASITYWLMCFTSINVSWKLIGNPFIINWLKGQNYKRRHCRRFHVVRIISPNSEGSTGLVREHLTASFELFCLLWHDAMQFFEGQLKLLWNTSPASWWSRRSRKPCKKPVWSTQ
jgi:hypothetical protein